MSDAREAYERAMQMLHPTGYPAWDTLTAEMRNAWWLAPEPPLDEAPQPFAVERHVSRRCPDMDAHAVSVPVPCSECYSVESFWRRIPYEPDSRSAAVIVVRGVTDG